MSDSTEKEYLSINLDCQGLSVLPASIGFLSELRKLMLESNALKTL